MRSQRTARGWQFLVRRTCDPLAAGTKHWQGVAFPRQADIHATLGCTHKALAGGGMPAGSVRRPDAAAVSLTGWLVARVPHSWFVWGARTYCSSDARSRVPVV
jgi:hypothetical protein